MRNFIFTIIMILLLMLILILLIPLIIIIIIIPITIIIITIIITITKGVRGKTSQFQHKQCQRKNPGRINTAPEPLLRRVWSHLDAVSLNCSFGIYLRGNFNLLSEEKWCSRRTISLYSRPFVPIICLLHPFIASFSSGQEMSLN